MLVELEHIFGTDFEQILNRFKFPTIKVDPVNYYACAEYGNGGEPQ